MDLEWTIRRRRIGRQELLLISELIRAEGHRGRSYISKLHAVSERIIPIEPPAHDLTDFWKAGGDLRCWVAKHIYQAMAPAMNNENAMTLVRWKKVLSHIEDELNRAGVNGTV